jgi:PAS domain S-box-containing protein
MNGQEPNAGQQSEAERCLRENERRLATLLSNLPGMAYRCKNDRDRTMEFVSDGCEALTGYKAADLVGADARSFNSLIHPDDRERIWNEVQEALKRGLPYRLTYRIIAADGREKWVWEQGGGVYSGTDLEALEGFITDITERKAAEARVKTQNERFQKIIENTDAGYFRIGMNGCFEDVNPAWLRMYGFTRREEAIGLHFSAVQIPEDAAKAEEVVEALMRAESPGIGEFSRLRRDGTTGYHRFSVNPVLDGGRVIGVEGFIIDISDQKTADEERRHTEQRYRSLFDSMREGVAIHKLFYSNGAAHNYMLLDVNRRYEEILGVKREQVVNKWATDVYGTETPPYLREFSSVFETGTAFQFETYFPPMDRHFLISVAPMGEDTFATIFFDVTEQKKTEESYKLISENAADVIWLWDLAEERCVYVSPSARHLRGFSPEEIMAQPMEQAMPPDTYRMVMARLQRRSAAVEAGDEAARIGTNEIDFLRKDGTSVTTETVTKLISDERRPIRHILGISRDITERKRAEEALRQANEAVAQAERHYRRIFNSGSDVVFVHQLGEDGLPGPFLEVNDNGCRYLGYTREELLRMRVLEIIPPEEHPLVPAIGQRLLANGQSIWEGEMVAKDGRRIPVEINCHLFDLNGLPTMISCVRDITERKAAATAKAQLEEQLRQAQKLESVGRLAGGVAHDFNNLLTVINGYSGFMLKRLEVGDPLRSYADEIKTAGERAASLTKQLLAFSRKQIIEPRVLDLNSTIRESAPMLQRLIGEDVALDTHLDDSLGQVMADPDQIHQVIMNLAVNARDAMPDGGRLEIKTLNVDLGAEDGTAIHPHVSPGRYVLMDVTDNGYGMEEPVRQQIFEPFFTTKETGKGTGLGLSTAYGIIRQSGGWIDVQSEVGNGTSFKVYLPRIDAAPAPQRNGIDAPVARGSETILVVEDQTAVRGFAVASLQECGYRVIEASDGGEAISVAEKYAGEIHLLLTDVVMPGISGKESSERLRNMRPNLKVLFVSGYTADVVAQHGVSDGNVMLLHKPFSPVALAWKVREVLDGREY